jgi:NAD(P)-dependent dehydrogenase (short-subunit alcohol dehydrogenase family)
MNLNFQEKVAFITGAGGGIGRAAALAFAKTGDVQAAALDRAFQEFGRLDFAFNNAGSEQPVIAAADLTEQTWTRIVDVNLNGVYRQFVGLHSIKPEPTLPASAHAEKMTCALAVE